MSVAWQDARVNADPVAFAQQRVAEWNSHNLDRVLAHYAPDVVFRSPVAALVAPGSDGVVHGLDALRHDWSTALEQVPDLHFEVLEIFAGVSTVVIRFRNQLGAVRCEVLKFEDGLIVEGEGTDLLEPSLRSEPPGSRGLTSRNVIPLLYSLFTAESVQFSSAADTQTAIDPGGLVGPALTAQRLHE